MDLLLLLRRLHPLQLSNRPYLMIRLFPRRPFTISRLFLDQILHPLLRVKKHLLPQALVGIWRLHVLLHVKKLILPQALAVTCRLHGLNLNHHQAGKLFNLPRSQKFLKPLL